MSTLETTGPEARRASLIRPASASGPPRTPRATVLALVALTQLACSGTFGTSPGFGARLVDRDAEARGDGEPARPDADGPPDGGTPTDDAMPGADAQPSQDGGTFVFPDAQPDAGPAALEVPIQVKEVAGVGCASCLVTTVVPLPRGRFQDTRTLRVVDGAGNTVPAQFEVVNRHWVLDNSLRHVAVHFQPTVNAFRAAGSGLATYRLQDVGGTIAPLTPVTVTEAKGRVVLDSGAARIVVTRSPFAIETPAGPLEAIFFDRDGREVRSFDRNDVQVEVEERGPVRAVLRAESPARVENGRIRHGWAIRLYVAAGEPGVKVDVQLQNSAKNQTFTGPLFFDAFVLRLATGQTTTARNVRAERVTANPIDRLPGFLDAGPVQAMVRHFWEKWPNGIAVDAAGTLSVELYPGWSARPYVDQQPSTSGLHWLNDMQHNLKEVYLRFGAIDAAELERRARSFQFHPVGTLPVRWYADTEVTLDMGGYFPIRERTTTMDQRRPDYVRYNANPFLPNLSDRFGYTNFAADLMRKSGPSTAGGWPYSNASFFVTENPADYYAVEDLALAEINVMPEHMTGYTYAADFAQLGLTENPYGGYSWRRFDGTYGYDPVPGYIAGTGQDAKPRDDQHAWFYHVEEAYYATYNLWLRDWYRFVGQFRRTRLNQRDPFPDMSGRAAGHAIAHALQAYRVTGDTALYDEVGRYIRDYIAPLCDPRLGGIIPRADYPAEAVFQLGYLARALISYIEERSVAERDVAAFNVVAGLVRWNMRYGLFGYYTGLTTANTQSSGTAMTFGDPQAWYAVQANDPAAMEQLRAFVDTGIGGGERPYVDLRRWAGDFNGRVSTAAFSMFR